MGWAYCRCDPEIIRKKCCTRCLDAPRLYERSRELYRMPLLQRRCAYRPYIVESVAKAVIKLADHYKASKVAVIGHSGGGAILAGGLGEIPEFAPNLAVFVASNLNVPKWIRHRGFRNGPSKKSLSPHQLTAKVSPEVEVVAITGSADSNAIPELAREYVQLMKNDGKKPRFVEIPGASHNGVMQDERLWKMISDMLKKLET